MKTLFAEGEMKSEHLDLNEGVKDQVAILFTLLSPVPSCLIHTQPFQQGGLTIFPFSDARH